MQVKNGNLLGSFEMDMKDVGNGCARDAGRMIGGLAWRLVERSHGPAARTRFARGSRREPQMGLLGSYWGFEYFASA